MTQRPNVVVFQEFDDINVVPDIPDLDALIVGPCYQLLDYLDDKTDIYAADYGLFGYDSPFNAFTYPDAVTVTSLPYLLPGAQVDAASVAVFLDEIRVVITERGIGPSGEDGVYTAGDNLFLAHDTAVGNHFASEGVAVGDIFYITSPSSPVPGSTPTVGNDYVKTVREVIEVLNDYGGTLDFVTVAGVQAGDSVIITADTAGNTRNGTYTVHRVRDDENLELVGTGWLGNFGTPGACTVDIKSPSGVSRLVGPKTLSLRDYGEVRVTADFVAAPPGGQDISWRAERALADVALDATDFSVTGNSVTVNANITLDLSATLLARPVSFAKIYTEYKALRTDLQNIIELSTFSAMEAALGKFDARNPLFVGAVVAKANTTTPVNVYGVAGTTLPAYLEFIERIDSKRNVYAIAPMTYDTTIIASINNMCETLADPNYALDNGTRQKFRVCLGAVDLPETETLVNAQSGGTAYTSLGTTPSPALSRQATLVVTGVLPALDFTGLGVEAGATVVLFDSTAPAPGTTTFTVAQILGASALLVDEDTTTPITLNTPGDTINIYPAGGGGPLYTGTLIGGDTVVLTGVTVADLWTTLEIPGADFITNGVIPGDLLQMPLDPEVSLWTTFNSWIIDEVLSEDRVRIVSDGPNTSQLANEIPHLFKQTDGTAITGSLMYGRVVRELSKAEQVTAMAAVASSFASRRLVLSYPNLVDVSGLVDGGKARTSTGPEVADSQPGYYLAAAICGQTAGLPPQQGFTNYGISGITKIYNADNYFSEKQLTDLSNSGINVYSQDTDAALPKSIHSVTTDTTSLEFSEYMVVKDYDFIAWTNLDALLGFIGIWNVSKETIEFIRQSITSTNDTLKTRFVAKIGAPLQAYSIEHVGVSEISADRIEAFVDVDLPIPLNTIGLHLVA